MKPPRCKRDGPKKGDQLPWTITTEKKKNQVSDSLRFLADIVSDLEEAGVDIHGYLTDAEKEAWDGESV